MKWLKIISKRTPGSILRLNSYPKTIPNTLGYYNCQIASFKRRVCKYKHDDWPERQKWLPWLPKSRVFLRLVEPDVFLVLLNDAHLHGLLEEVPGHSFENPCQENDHASETADKPAFKKNTLDSLIQARIGEIYQARNLISLSFYFTNELVLSNRNLLLLIWESNFVTAIVCLFDYNEFFLNPEINIKKGWGTDFRVSASLRY